MEIERIKTLVETKPQLKGLLPHVLEISVLPSIKGAVRLASIVAAQIGEILKILDLAKFQSIFENEAFFF